MSVLCFNGLNCQIYVNNEIIGLKQVLNCYVVYNLHYMFNIVDYFIDYKYLEDTLKNLNMMKYLCEQDWDN